LNNQYAEGPLLDESDGAVSNLSCTKEIVFNMRYSHPPKKKTLETDFSVKLTWPNPAFTNALTNVAARFCLAESRMELAPRP
jgi:hypothetical protein